MLNLANLLLHLMAVCQTCSASFIIPGMHNDVYFRPGDLVLGGLFRIHHFSPSQICSTDIQSVKQFQFLEAMVYAVSMVNKNPHILPNTALGIAILDDCTRDQAALARAMSWVPPAPCCDCPPGTRAPYYEVVGVVSGSNSQNTLTAANLLNVFNIPMVGTTTTSELLSDKVKYKNFIRVVPSDKFQAQVIIDILLHHNWTYISVINSPGGYGEVGIKAVKALAEVNGICIAYAYEVDESKDDDEEEFDDIIDNLLRFRNARAVVMFVRGSHGHKIIKAAQMKGYRDHFIWITSDSVGPTTEFAGIEDTAVGGFHVQLYSAGDAGFNKYFAQLSPTSSDNPWITELWQKEFGCNPTGANGYKTCNVSKTMQDLPGYRLASKAALFLDSVNTFAFALHAYIQDNCPNALWKHEEVRSCIKPAKLLPYLYNVTFTGTYGTVKFDEKGDADGKYSIEQLQKVNDEFVVKTVGFWDKGTRILSLDDRTYWNTKSVDGVNIPESLCSKPCNPGEIYVQLELKCCWNCRKCRNNEITINNASSCKECPLFLWPDQDLITTCVPIPPIPPTYLNSWQDTLEPEYNSKIEFLRKIWPKK